MAAHIEKIDISDSETRALATETEKRTKTKGEKPKVKHASLLTYWGRSGRDSVPKNRETASAYSQEPAEGVDSLGQNQNSDLDDQLERKSWILIRI